ncbi:acetate--CoA ligase family protein [Sulfitobacter sp. F26169L]|uniref:acetate--CoA ligase family protein n=1 Tax=Sulfitobacter sp. F26169L TaxID=2996015 RepID=UPI002260996D|nr:acetate--CoA ligase family protein [Sulfitobacter sp. F26169L]MCX7566006.1 acetate--CoA ligase family protein [Sulfitobacter sp. F26169L]
MSADLGRLLRPRSIAVIGGGAWCSQIVRQLHGIGFTGRVDLVHPRCGIIEGIPTVRDLSDLSSPPDAAFVGVNRKSAIEVIRSLALFGAGGAVCFASGFAEASAEDRDGKELQAELVKAAGEMPLLGPNCYGFINALDRALLWPDQHGCDSVARGVAILTQSSNIAINLTMQQRGLPIGYVVACGNMAQTTQAQIALQLLDDPRVTAIGLHIEGFGDLAEWYALAHKACDKGVPLIALKVGRSDQAQHAAVSHTASLAGSDAGASALLKRLGIGRTSDLPTFLETLKLLHMVGPLDAPTLSSISCSGGEASLAADAAVGSGMTFPALTGEQRDGLADALGPMVALANPLDYHTYVWRDVVKMTAAWLPMTASHIGLTLVIVDYPHTDARDWDCATKAALAIRAKSGRPVAVVATLPELMPPDVAAELMAGGVVAISGLTEAIAAASIAASLAKPVAQPVLNAGADREAVLVDEAQAKAALSGFGVLVPKGATVRRMEGLKTVAASLTAPLVLKVTGLAHKSEACGVRLGLAVDEVFTAAQVMPEGAYLVEEMVQEAVVELLIGVTRDPAHGFVLTLGAGGVLTELWQDTASMLIPADPGSVVAALKSLRIWPLIEGYRGKSGADLNAIIRAVMGVQEYVIVNASRVSEVEINPLMCTPDTAVAVDALLCEARGE